MLCPSAPEGSLRTRPSSSQPALQGRAGGPAPCPSHLLRRGHAPSTVGPPGALAPWQGTFSCPRRPSLGSPGLFSPSSSRWPSGFTSYLPQGVGWDREAAEVVREATGWVRGAGRAHRRAASALSAGGAGGARGPVSRARGRASAHRTGLRKKVWEEFQCPKGRRLTLRFPVPLISENL